MTKNRSMKIAVLVLALALLTSCFVGSTFAKYTSSANGSGTATVAKWDVAVNGTDIAVVGSAPSIAFNLVETVVDDDDATSDTDDANVVNGLIAPGTAGKFDIKVTNTSEVAAEYDITFGVSYDNLPDGTTSIPLKYSTDGTTWKTSITDINVVNEALAATTGTDTVTVYWMWAFDGDDTALGIAASTANAPKVTVTAAIVVDQAD